MSEKFILIEPAVEGWRGHYYEYAARVLRAVKARGFQAILAANRAFDVVESNEFAIFSIYKAGQGLIPKTFPFYFLQKWKSANTFDVTATRQTSFVKSLAKTFFERFKINSFFNDTTTLFEKFPLTSKDIVFFPTTTEIEVKGLVKFLRKNPRASQATWHLLFHSNIIPKKLIEGLRELKKLELANLYFYTDTQELTQQYNALDLVTFATLPIPIDPSFATHVSTHESSLRVSYIGDARAEKGYQHLPNVVEQLWEEYIVTNKLEFVIQSNFNIPEGEPQAVAARAELEKFASKVKLIKTPLKPEDYSQLILTSNLIIFPYDSKTYAARSSGIFSEAMVAGIPVVVPEGSWMAKQLKIISEKIQIPIPGVIYQDIKDLPTSIIKAYLQYQDYLQAAKVFSKTWSAYHNPENLLTSLCEACSN